MQPRIEDIDVMELMAYILHKQINFLYNDCLLSIKNTGLRLYEDVIRWEFSIFSDDNTKCKWLISINELYDIIHGKVVNNSISAIMNAWWNAFLFGT
jgi:hypothetical protein